jgi:predicted nucleic acid-binding protein
MLEEFLAGVVVLGLDEEICKRFGQFRGSLGKRGQTVGDFDLLIAATALLHNLTLLTNNRKHFEGVAGLQIESR